MQDNDVHAERKKVLSGATTDNDVVIIKNLVKVSNSCPRVPDSTHSLPLRFTPPTSQGAASGPPRQLWVVSAWPSPVGSALGCWVSMVPARLPPSVS